MVSIRVNLTYNSTIEVVTSVTSKNPSERKFLQKCFELFEIKHHTCVFILGAAVKKSKAINEGTSLWATIFILKWYLEINEKFKNDI